MGGVYRVGGGPRSEPVDLARWAVTRRARWVGWGSVVGGAVALVVESTTGNAGMWIAPGVAVAVLGAAAVVQRRTATEVPLRELIEHGSFADAAARLDRNLPGMWLRSERNVSLVLRARLAAAMGELPVAAALIGTLRGRLRWGAFVTTQDTSRLNASWVPLFNFDAITRSTCWFESVVYRLGFDDLVVVAEAIAARQAEDPAGLAALAARAHDAVVRADRNALIAAIDDASPSTDRGLLGIDPPLPSPPYIELLADAILARWNV